MLNKNYYREYYQKNREKIIFRVKTNYYRNKFQKEDKREIPTISKSLVVSFD